MWKIALERKWLPFHIFIILSIVFCLRLGLWQWIRRERVDALTGDVVISLQSSFYAGQWVFFAIAAGWFWYRFFRDEYLSRTGQLKKRDE
ncbi:MAG: hypothetical protein RIS18_43 [Actinomycetota bacterium]|jgi:hypothetical protein